jgi:acetolactate synthase-1/2/3 large subunit
MKTLMKAVDGFAVARMTFGNPDFVAYEQSYGAQGHRVTEAGGLAPTLEKAFAAGGLHLVVVPVGYSENVRALVDELADMQH